MVKNKNLGGPSLGNNTNSGPKWDSVYTTALSTHFQLGMDFDLIPAIDYDPVVVKHISDKLWIGVSWAVELKIQDAIHNVKR